MTTNELFDLLKQNADKSLVFEYAPNQWIQPNYHITEVKHISVDSVDCGSQLDQWNETIVQLYESPNEPKTEDYMSVYKALGILTKVGKMKAYDLSSEIKFEYSNPNFHTAQLFVDDFDITSNNLVLKLSINQTDCKAKDICGIEEPNKLELTNSTSCCDPKSGCC